MSPNFSRRVGRLEELARSHAAVLRDEEQERALRFWCIAGNAAVLAFLARNGNPQIGEPLARAMERCSESDAWRQCCRRFKARLIDRHEQWPFFPETKNSVLLIGQPVRHFVISSFSGANEKAKLDAAFAELPPWFVWHTFGDYTAAWLGLRIPDLTDVSRFMRSELDWQNWWGVPTRAFERTLWPNDEPDDERLARVGCGFPGDEENRIDENITPRERRRQRLLRAEFKQADAKSSWPHLESEELLQLTLEEHRAVYARAGRRAGVAPEPDSEPRPEFAVDIHSVGAPHFRE